MLSLQCKAVLVLMIPKSFPSCVQQSYQVPLFRVQVMC